MAVEIRVTVKPQARKVGIKRFPSGEYQISVHAPPQGGKANQELIELLAVHFSVPKSAIKIMRGQYSKKKLIAIG